MKFKNEIIYNKAKQLRGLLYESISSSAFEDAYLREKLLKLSFEIPLQIGLSLNLDSVECIRLYLDEAEFKLIELYIAVDLSMFDYLQIDRPKLNSLIEEILELIPISHEKAEEEEEKRFEESMKEFYVEM